MSTIHDVARLAGVSISTVSRALGNTGLISEGTQSRVRDAAGELNYRPRARQRTVSGPARKSTKREPAVVPVRDTIGFQFFAATSGDTLAVNTFYAAILSGAQSEASSERINILVHTTDRHALSNDASFMIDDRSVQGLLLVGSTDPAVISAISARVQQLVLVDNPDPVDEHDSVLSDGFQGGYDATRHLIELGHRRIAFFNPEMGVVSFRDRQRGYVTAMFEAGLPLDSELLFEYTSTTYTENEQLLKRRLMNGGSEPVATAIVCANDFYAMLAVNVCRNLDLSVPEQMSIVGYDDLPSSAIFSPPLTTIRVNNELIGRMAVVRLAARIEEFRLKKAPLGPCRYIVPVHLTVRGSTCPPVVSAA